MRLLLDSHVLLWWFDDDSPLGANAVEMIEAADVVFVSAATAWELEIKQAIGKLQLPADLVPSVPDAGFSWLPMTAEHAVAAARLPLHHRDPFDRMLIAQAGSETLTLMSSDRLVGEYEVRLVDPLT